MPIPINNRSLNSLNLTKVIWPWLAFVILPWCLVAVIGRSFHWTTLNAVRKELSHTNLPGLFGHQSQEEPKNQRVLFLTYSVLSLVCVVTPTRKVDAKLISKP